jgi:NAD(P)-dependent dehydrogenase (short-subunit alcohol dehydrogenase family)
VSQTLIISGASSGIGLAIASHFDAAGYRVFNLDIQPGKVGETLICDMRNHQSVLDAVAQVAEQGPIDLVVSNAGRHLSANIENTSEEAFINLFELNVKGAFSLTQAVIPHMKAAGKGVIVYIGSDQSSIAKPNSCAYNLSKHALASLAKTTALDYASHGIRSNLVCPGTIDTPLYRKAINSYCERSGAKPEEVHAEEAALQPIGRIGKPEEVAAMVAYLASDEAGFVTGGSFPIDGGYTVG